MHSAGKTKGIVDNKITAMVLLVIIVITIVIPLIFFGNEKENGGKIETQQQNLSAPTKTEPKPVFRDSTLIDSGTVVPGKLWKTRIDFRYARIYSSENILVRYTSRNGGWTERVLVPASGNRTKSPQNVDRGPVEITLADTSSAKNAYVKLFEMKK